MKPWAVQIKGYEFTECRRFESYPEALSFFHVSAAERDAEVASVVLLDFRGRELLDSSESWSGAAGDDLAEGFYVFDEASQSLRPAAF